MQAHIGGRGQGEYMVQNADMAIFTLNGEVVDATVPAIIDNSDGSTEISNVHWRD